MAKENRQRWLLSVLAVRRGKHVVTLCWITFQRLPQQQHHIYHQVIFEIEGAVVVGGKKTSEQNEPISHVKQNKTLQYFMLRLLTTHYLITLQQQPCYQQHCMTAHLPRPRYAHHIQNSSEEVVVPLLKLSHTAHPPQQTVDTDPTITCWLLGLAYSLSNTWEDYQEDRAELPYWSQEKRQQS